MGAKGIGKTTLLDQIVKRKRNDHFIGFPNVKKIAYLAQENEFRVGLTVREIINFIYDLNKVLDLEMPPEITKLLDCSFNDLTKDEHKLVLIYINLLVDKELYLFDEPGAGIDLSCSKMVFGWFRELAELDKTVIVTTSRLDNIYDIDNVNYIKNTQEIIADNYLKIKARMAF
ncbi:hypothetical protein LNA01_21740 [Companilactobacillus nantensis]|uniref:ABC-type cobalt transport system, ATPase component n=1 Tax=Companilactobacillus nantensis DSM 16982 TaxID=1423774 RepID=A0A0R1WJ10_9LACO|nr:ABC-type cobalt transport system, ATPase component [Companilactobacillus nantensis DSM 16982]GEO64991.1 hypothetical protein LNA01_21740 [Companilactobacillus nantensis]